MTKREPWTDRAGFMREWLAALRGGTYAQCRGMLNLRGEGFCCLGVACDLAPEVGERPYDYDESLQFYCEKEAEDGSTYSNRNATYLPDEFRYWLCITCKEQQSLANRNDSGQSFNEIADYIEREILPRLIERWEWEKKTHRS